MKRLAFALSLVAATAFAAPLAAQSSNGPWWDPANTGNRTDSRNGGVYNDGRVSNDGRIYDTRNTDGRWRRVGRDNRGNYIYARNRYDSNGNLVQELARRDTLGRYRVYDRRVVQYARNNRNNRGVYDRDNDRNNDGYQDRYDKNGNDRWAQNNGHDNGKHNGQYKNKGKNKNRRD
jgi:hypothetical protein